MPIETAPAEIPPTDLARDAQLFEYSQAANPIESGATPSIPVRVFTPDLYAAGESRFVPLDLSPELRTPYAATGPSLLASFVRIRAGEQLTSAPNASSEFFYVIAGSGRTETAEGAIAWSGGDFVALPIRTRLFTW